MSILFTPYSFFSCSFPLLVSLRPLPLCLDLHLLLRLPLYLYLLLISHSSLVKSYSYIVHKFISFRRGTQKNRETDRQRGRERGSGSLDVPLRHTKRFSYFI